ncbi:PREDICTED: coiled-coil domain-containing protein 58-like [Acropora digitifera]|uniref:coiled-coil domain-containing protein 58-like n=1 Tax=Acropora digitifera TaxID=70779 RepID=UPI00077A1D0B|nr:PREDICTED: coiled-coil domain-containing protein 58-like [Acropora digitifera]
MAAGGKELSQMSCEDFGQFKEALKILRLIDDKIIYELNKSVPTASFSGEINAGQKCRELYTELLAGYQTREQAIKRCINTVNENTQQLRERRDKNPDDYYAMRDLRKEQTKLRLMQSELSVEEVLQQRTLKVFNERCWKSFKPPQ